MFKASANIRPSRFVAISGNYTVAEAGAGVFCYGISQEFGESAPIPSVTSELAATSGNPVAIYDGTEPATVKPLLVIGAGGCTAGAFLKSSATGEGIATAVANDLYGAVALEPGAAGEGIRVHLIRGKV